MSSGFDFYGAPNTSGAPNSPTVFGLPAASGATPVDTPTVDRWGLPGTGGYAVSSVDLSSPFATSAYATSGHRRPWYAVIAVVVIAVTAVAFYVLRLPHPVALPSSLAGLQKVHIPAGQGQALDVAKKSLSHEGLHDVSVGIYGASDVSGPGLVVISARASSGVPDFSQLFGAMSSAGAVAGVTVTPQPVTGVITAWRCVTTTAQGQSALVCAWQGSHAVLIGVGRNMSAQDETVALEQVREQDSLR